MDLKIKDVAELLHVSEKMIFRCINENKIPYYRINNQYRFNRGELNEWMLTNRDITPAEALSARAAESGVDLSECLRRGGIYYHVAGNCVEDAIRNAMSTVNLPPELNREETIVHLLNREAIMPTAVGCGVAIPHPRSPIVAEIANESLAICFLAEPVNFKAADGKLVHVMFIVLSANQPRHLEILFKISSLCLQEQFMGLLLRRASETEIIAYIESMKSKWKR